MAAAAQYGRASDYVVLRDFGHIQAVAVTNAGLFAATTGGIAIYDVRADRWVPPVTSVDGLPNGNFIMALGDPADESVWFATQTGIVHYLPVLREVVHIPTSGTPVQMAFDRNDPFRGIYFATRSGWFFSPRGSAIATPTTEVPGIEDRVTSLTVREALEREPGALATRSTVLIDERLRRNEFTSVAWDDVSRSYFFGTDGAGIARYDPSAGEFELLPFGLLADRVGAVLWHEGSVWTGTGGRDGRRGFTHLDGNLQFFAWDQGPGAATYQFFEVRALHEWEGEIWAATDMGVLRVDEPDHVVSRDLPSPSAYSLTTTPGGLWVGTARGLATLRRFESAGVVVEEVHVTNSPVVSLRSDGHDVWIGTSNGLLWLPVSADEPTAPPGVQQLALSRDAVVGIALVNGELFAATPEALYQRQQPSVWVETVAVTGRVGRITSIAEAEDGEGIWIGGDNGLAHLQPQTRALQSVVDGRGLPGRVSDIYAGGGFVWVATDRGLIRLRPRI